MEFAVTSPTGTRPSTLSDELADILNDSTRSVTSITYFAATSITPRNPSGTLIFVTSSFIFVTSIGFPASHSLLVQLAPL